MRHLLPNIAMFLKAMEYYGIEEIPGKEHNPQILEFFSATMQTWVHSDEIGSCSAFMNHIAYECGCERSYQSLAKSWLNIGKRVCYPVLGNLVVFWRIKPKSWEGHCGLFTGFSPKGHIYCLGSNQDNMINVKLYDKKYFLAFIQLPFV